MNTAHGRSIINRFAILFLLVGAFCGVADAEPGPPIEVAPQAKESRNQSWASAEWCEGAKCWLVVWREGYLNEGTSTVWCARVSAEGKALDSAGVVLASGEEFRDRPRVASDGKKFLVVWEDMRNGEDWDVYGAVVPAEGTISGIREFLVAGGAHNQARPDVAFAKGNYHVLWMGYGGPSYAIYGTRVSPDGKLLGEAPATIAAIKSRKKNNFVQATLPAIAANEKGDLLSAFHVRDSFRLTYLARRPVDAATGQPTGTAPTHVAEKNSPGGKGWGGRERTVALAMGPDGALSVSTTATTRSAKDLSVGKLSLTGEVLDVEEVGSSLSIDAKFKPFASRLATTWIGNGYVVVGDVLGARGKKKRRPSAADYYARVLCWRMAADGAPQGEAIAVAGEPGRECLLPDVSGGPNGGCLVVYSEVRGVDDVKVVARIVK
jgi:hypothetical protein